MKWLDEGILEGGYGVEMVMFIKKMVNEFLMLRNKHVLVIGSERPWIEVILLSLNVGHITTLEYNSYITDHPKISKVSPIDFGHLVKSGKAPMFDGMVTFSSIEHSGLGR